MPTLADRLKRRLRFSRMALASLLLPILAFSLPDATQSALRLIYMLLGFSLIIFLHELGHFIVARLCSVKCLAFSIGIGPRMCGWRKGGKLSFGNDPYDPDNKPKPSEGAATEHDLQTTTHTAPHSPALGDCDYRVSWLPLGGYVRMLGQDDMDPTKISTDPHAFNQRPIWQRMCIVSAGVIMNVIFAAVAFSIIFHPGIGVQFPAPIVGAVYQDMPAAGQLHMGDEILSIDGKQPIGKLEFVDVQMAFALSDGEHPVMLRVRPYRTHGEADHDVQIVPKKSDATNLLAAGVESMPGLKIADAGKDYTAEIDPKNPTHDGVLEANAAELAKIRKGDRIVAVDGETLDGPVPYMALYNHLQDGNGAKVALTLENTKDPKLPQQTITLLPSLETMWGLADFPSVFGMAPRTVIDDPIAKSPAAKANLMAGDQLVYVGARKYPTAEQLKQIVTSSNGDPIHVEVARQAQGTASQPAAELVSADIAPRKIDGELLLGVHPRQDLEQASFIPPPPDSPVGKLGLPDDARITAVAGAPVKNWYEIYSELRKQRAGADVPITFASSEGTRTVPLALSAEDAHNLAADLHYRVGLHLEFQMINQEGKNASEAVLLGLDHTKKFIVQVYMTLAGLFRGTVSPSNLHGIVGITKVGYDVQERGPVWLWYVLAMVSVNLAVANFLPLPIVDGGLFLLLILEKIRGKPLSLKVQSAIQLVGVVLLIGLFLFVTYNDIGLFHK